MCKEGVLVPVSLIVVAVLFLACMSALQNVEGIHLFEIQTTIKDQTVIQAEKIYRETAFAAQPLIFSSPCFREET